MDKALRSFQELGSNKFALPTAQQKPTAQISHTRFKQHQPQSRSVVPSGQLGEKLGRKARMLNQLQQEVGHARKTHTEVLKQIEIACAQLESIRKQLEQERANLPS